MAVPDSIIQRMAREFGAHYFRNWEGFGERDVPHVVTSMREALAAVPCLTELIEAAMDYSVAGFKVASKRHLVQAAIAFARANGEAK